MFGTPSHSEKKSKLEDDQTQQTKRENILLGDITDEDKSEDAKSKDSEVKVNSVNAEEQNIEPTQNQIPTDNDVGVILIDEEEKEQNVSSKPQDELKPAEEDTGIIRFILLCSFRIPKD